MYLPYITQMPLEQILTVVTFGSRLYGTNIASSDHDFKAIYLPSLYDLVMGAKGNVAGAVYKERYDDQGRKITDANASITSGGIEIEYLPVQKLVREYAQGQAWATEVLHAYRQGHYSLPRLIAKDVTSDPLIDRFHALVNDLVDNYKTSTVRPMLDFATSQTYDYVRRAENYVYVGAILGVARELMNESERPSKVRLNAVYNSGFEKTYLDVLTERLKSKNVELRIGQTESRHGLLKGIVIAGRCYQTTLLLRDLVLSLESLHETYGKRVISASLKPTEWKSLSHAVRVYTQIDEYLASGVISFPRPNTEELRKIKNAELPFEYVQELLKTKDQMVIDRLAQECNWPTSSDPEYMDRVNRRLWEFLSTAYQNNL